MGTHKCKSAQR